MIELEAADVVPAAIVIELETADEVPVGIESADEVSEVEVEIDAAAVGAQAEAIGFQGGHQVQIGNQVAGDPMSVDPEATTGQGIEKVKVRTKVIRATIQRRKEVRRIRLWMERVKRKSQTTTMDTKTVWM
jgi:hypothetical protein